MRNGQASRRGFFKTVAIGGATAAAAVAAVVVGERKSPITSAHVDEPKQTGYRETEHIRQYYRSTQV